jgi:hypothetical protein
MGARRNVAGGPVFSNQESSIPRVEVWPPQLPGYALNPKAPCPPTWRFLLLASKPHLTNEADR